MKPYSLIRQPDSLDFTITPDPDQITIFDYVGEEIDYEALIFPAEVVMPEPVPEVVYRDTGVPMGYRHWAHPEPIDTVVYHICRICSAIKKGWDKLWERIVK